MSKFTYRRQPRETGLRGIVEPRPKTDIKLNKLIVGYINPPSRYNGDKWNITIAVKTEGQCPFRWAQFKTKFDSEEEARKWLDGHAESVISKYDLYQFED